MAERPRYPDPGDETGAESGREYPGMPRWVKITAIIVVVLFLLVVGIVLADSEGHGPGRHGPAASTPAGELERNPPPIDGASLPAITGGAPAFHADRIELTASEAVTLTSAGIRDDLVVGEIP